MPGQAYTEVAGTVPNPAAAGTKRGQPAVTENPYHFALTFRCKRLTQCRQRCSFATRRCAERCQIATRHLAKKQIRSEVTCLCHHKNQTLHDVGTSRTTAELGADPDDQFVGRPRVAARRNQRKDSRKGAETQRRKEETAIAHHKQAPRFFLCVLCGKKLHIPNSTVVFLYQS